MQQRDESDLYAMVTRRLVGTRVMTCVLYNVMIYSSDNGI